MSLAIQICSVFEAENEKVQPIQCICKIEYGTPKSTQEISKILVSEKQSHDYIVLERNRNSKIREHFLDYSDDHDALGESLIGKSNDNLVVYKLDEIDGEIKEGHQLIIACYKLRTKLMRKVHPFGKYVMLVDLLKLKSDKNNGEEVTLKIEDNLIDPKHGRMLNVRFPTSFNLNLIIAFYLEFNKGKNHIHGPV